MAEANVSPRRASRGLTWLPGRGERGTPLACQPREWIYPMFGIDAKPVREGGRSEALEKRSTSACTLSRDARTRGI